MLSSSAGRDSGHLHSMQQNTTRIQNVMKSIAEKYYEVNAYAKEASRYKRGIILRMFLVYSFMSWKFKPVYRKHWRFIYWYRGFSMWNWILLWNWTEYIGKMPANHKVLFEQISSKTQKRNPLFPVFTSDFPMQTLASMLQDKLDIKRSDAEKLLLLNDLRRRTNIKFGPKELAGLVLALSGLLLNIIPREFIEHLGLDYSKYIVDVFSFTIFIALYILILLGPILLGSIKTKRELQLCEILLHFCILNEHVEKEKSDTAITSDS